MKLTKKQWAVELGYGHKPHNDTLIRNYESGKKELPPWTARLAYMIHEHFLAEEGCLPDWPDHLQQQEQSNERHSDRSASQATVVSARSRADRR
jgi:hypothetical protein